MADALPAAALAPLGPILHRDHVRDSIVCGKHAGDARGRVGTRGQVGRYVDVCVANGSRVTLQ
jgi:hypothetical protein